MTITQTGHGVRGNTERGTGETQRAQTRCYVLDTSVILADPAAPFRFAEHDVVLPVPVLTELERKRDDPELGAFARQALRALDDLRATAGRLDVPVPVGNDGGTLRIAVDDADQRSLPSGLRGSDNDAKILATAAAIAGDGTPVVLVTKDLPLRIKAASIGMDAQAYRAEQSTDPGWSGIASLTLSGAEMSDLYETEVALSDEVAELPVNTGLVIRSERGSALGRVTGRREVRLVRGDREVFGLRGRSAEQRLAIDLLLDEEVGIVSLGGRAGTGKSALALCAGLDAVLERRQHRRIVVFRPLYAVGGQELGYLPGDQGDKMNPWGQAVFDTLESVVSPNVLAEVQERGLIEVLPLTHIRGRSLHDAFVIVDEAQSLERGVLLTVLSRIGQRSRVVLTHDVAQRDNLRVGRHDGIASVVDALRGNRLFGHVTLTRSERSEIAALVSDLLEGPGQD